MKNLLKSLLFAIAPKKMAVFQSIRSRRKSHKLVSKWGLLGLNKKLLKNLGNKVQSGPFAGMLLSEDAFKEHVGPYLLGTYESELRQAWPIILDRQYKQILDIGSKFGFYAVGLALKYPEAEVKAFDIDPWAQKATEAMSRENGVSNLEVLGFCEPRWIKENLKKNALLISDCEGFEKVLFSEKLGTNQASLTAIIETHDNLVPGASDCVYQAFSSTHQILKLDIPDRGFLHGALDFLTIQERASAIREIRGKQEWLVCIPLDHE